MCVRACVWGREDRSSNTKIVQIGSSLFLGKGRVELQHDITVGGYIFSSGQFLFICYISELHPWLHHSPAPEAGGEQAEPIPSSLLHSQVVTGTPTDSLSCTNSSTSLTSPTLPHTSLHSLFDL